MTAIRNGNPLTPNDLYSPEQYATRRNSFRAQVIAHKKLRTLHVGPHMTLIFEDRLTVQYQVQEMLRIEGIVTPGAIEEELAAYNPLVPDGSNLKATLLIEYPDPAMRARELARLQRIEDHLYLEVDGCGRSLAIADEDLDRSNDSKTSAVHFVRFECTPAQIAAWRAGAAVSVGVADERYGHRVMLPAEVRAALALDFA